MTCFQVTRAISRHGHPSPAHYLRFTLSYRDVQELLAERELDISYETVRCWVPKFGPVIARQLRRRGPRPSNRWHLDEMVVQIAGARVYLWRAVDHEGEVLDMLVQRRRDSRAALRLMRKLLKKQGFAAKSLVTDKLRSYASAFRRLRLNCRMSRGCAKTIAPKTRIKRCDDGSAECSGSSRLAPPSRSSACTPPSTTPSTSSAISSRARRFGSSAPSRQTDDAMRSRPRDLASSVGLRDGCKHVSTQPRSLADGNRKSPFPSSARESGGVAKGRSGPETAARALLRK
jgi:IS1 family transposase